MKKTMRIHHRKHHNNYINKVNAPSKTYGDLQKLSAEELLANLNENPQEIRIAIGNNAGVTKNSYYFRKYYRQQLKENPEVILLKK